MKLSYTVTLAAGEVKDIERITHELSGEVIGQRGEFKVTKKSRLEYMAVKFKLKRTMKLEVSAECSPEYLAWLADSVERIAPLVRGLIPQLNNLQNEVVKSVLKLPEDGDVEEIVESDLD